MPTGIYKRTKPINRKYPNNEKPICPRLPRDKDLRYKLTEEQIRKINSIFQSGKYSCYILAKMFNVSYSTIYYWTHPSYRKYIRLINAKRVHTQTNYKEYIERKKKLVGKQFRKYNALRARKLRDKNK